MCLRKTGEAGFGRLFTFIPPALLSSNLPGVIGACEGRIVTPIGEGVTAIHINRSVLPLSIVLLAVL